MKPMVHPSSSRTDPPVFALPPHLTVRTILARIVGESGSNEFLDGEIESGKVFLPGT